MSKNTLSLDEALQRDLLPQLEIFDCPYRARQSKTGVVRIVFPEFTCVCPKTGYPDFARIVLCYFPDKRCLELKSWKLYLNAFRNIGAFHEAVTSHLFETVKKLLAPQWLLVAGDFFPRGNVDTTIVFETATGRPAGADLLMSHLPARCRDFS
ncbi:MAG: NADPH-dependent 7-cyano-7-deazaguanine reductase QueF [Chitinispirillaceae bacterium]|nr:NADPH-dependent 7-cyano-7-deazaguanine reductase QueF [Chitinispirillaceae bacterium]